MADTAPPSEEYRVSTLELFFDLVFVFTLTQLSTLLAADPSPAGVLRVVLVFVLVWWMYAAYAWLTNATPPDRAYRRVLLILGMAGFLICALAIPGVYRHGGLAFGLGYLVVVAVHTGLYGVVHPGATLRFGSLNLLMAGLVLLGGVVGPPVGYALWVAAIGMEIVTPIVTRRTSPELRLRPRLFVERHGLLLIIALGESVVAIGIGASGMPLDLSTVGGAALGLALAAALWWSYFGGDDEAAERVLVAASYGQQARLAINAYFYAYVPMLLGIVAAAAGVKKTLGHLPEPLGWGAAALLGGGVAAYLLGEAMFRRMTRIGSAGNRLVAAVAALAAIGIGAWITAVAQLAALVVILALMLGYDARTRAALSARAARSEAGSA
jgi:low temperature requirement protein LtrA